MQPTHGPNILVVDDEEDVRKLLGLVLSDAGFGIAEAGDGREAMRLIRKGLRPDLILTDLVMPEQEGIQTIREIRQLMPHSRIIAISGAFGAQFLSTARLLGADATLAKPIAPRDLLAAVHQLLPAPAAAA